MEENKKCPCQTVLELERQVDSQRTQLCKGETQFAVINTKLNLIMWVGATIAASVIGVIIKLIAG